MSNITFSDKESRKRNELLNERPVKIVFKTALPLLFYTFLKTAFLFFDVLTVSKIDHNMVSASLYITDIQNIFEYLFISMAIGVGIRISQAFGANDTDAIRRDLSTTFFTILFIGIISVGICIAFSKPILGFFGIPEEILEIGSVYFSISIFGTIFSGINTLYFASEKARGHTRIVSICNILLLASKLICSSAIMFMINNGSISKESAVILIPLSVCLSQFLVMMISLHGFFIKDSPFRVSFRYVSFNKEFFIPYIRLTAPIIMIKLMKSISKITLNSQCAIYGSIGLAAYACCNRICSIATAPIEAMQDPITTVVAANLGNHQDKRVKKTLSESLLLMLGFAVVLFTIVSLASETLMSYFANGNPLLLMNIRKLYLIERLDILFVALDITCSSYLFATKKTRLKTICSFFQLFIVRIPLLYLLINRLGMGIEAIALSILISNISATLFTVIVYFLVKKQDESSRETELSARNALIDAVKVLGRLDAFDSDEGYANGINVPTDILEIMKETYNCDLDLDQLSQEYRYALVEARIEELEKQENIYAQ
ncbi:MAG: hypothetical protein J6S38_07035 [Erysipelotrichaceae bacterium]|nr:hypothetical protein [Erysipelotrichaceae bacterium]